MLRRQMSGNLPKLFSNNCIALPSRRRTRAEGTGDGDLSRMALWGGRGRGDAQRHCVLPIRGVHLRKDFYHDDNRVEELVLPDVSACRMSPAPPSEQNLHSVYSGGAIFLLLIFVYLSMHIPRSFFFCPGGGWCFSEKVYFFATYTYVCPGGDIYIRTSLPCAGIQTYLFHMRNQIHFQEHTMVHVININNITLPLNSLI